MSQCNKCGRRFRDKASAELAKRYEAVHRELAGGEAAPHLSPLPSVPKIVFVSKRDRHIADSKAHRAGRL